MCRVVKPGDFGNKSDHGHLIVRRSSWVLWASKFLSSNLSIEARAYPETETPW